MRRAWPLRDFDPERDDLAELQRSLCPDDPERGTEILSAVMSWAGGHPYLTLSLANRFIKHPSVASQPVKVTVDEFVRKEFALLDGVPEDDKAHFTRITDYLTQRAFDPISAFQLYRRIRRGHKETDRTTPQHLDLKLSGIVKRNREGQLVVHNRIYERLFTEKWVKDSVPAPELRVRRLRRIVAVAVIALVLITGKLLLDFSTFQAEFRPVAYEGQRQEVIITRRFDPRPAASRFQQGTLIFLDECKDDDAQNEFKSRLKLDLGPVPTWSQFVPLISDSRLGLAELEWLERAITSPLAFMESTDVVGLSRVKQGPVTEALIALLKDHDSNIRSRAARSLGQMGNGGANVIEALLALLRVREWDVRSSTALALVELATSNPNVIESIVPLLNDGDSRVRYIVAASLLALSKGDVNVTEVLLELLKDQDSDIRSSAAASLGQPGKSDLNVIEALVALLKDQESLFRSSAAGSLGRLETSDSNVIDGLVALLKDQDSFVRSSAAASLGQLGKSEPSVIEALVSLTADRISFVRMGAAASLGQLGKNEPNVIEALVALLKDKDSDVRFSAAESLGQLGKSEPHVVEALVALLNDEDEVRYLRGIRDQVEKLRKDSRPWVKQASLWALYQIEKRKNELEEEARKAEQKIAEPE